jgi:hypothetical protein
VGARFGPAGGLSQPRRDTADPKAIRPRATEQFFNCWTIFDLRNQINPFLKENMPCPKIHTKNPKKNGSLTQVLGFFGVFLRHGILNLPEYC